MGDAMGTVFVFEHAPRASVVANTDTTSFTVPFTPYAPI
jgi:hypothetical protein